MAGPPALIPRRQNPCAAKILAPPKSLRRPNTVAARMAIFITSVPSLRSGTDKVTRHISHSVVKSSWATMYPTFVNVPHEVLPNLRARVWQEVVGPPDALLLRVPEHVGHGADVARLHCDEWVARHEGVGAPLGVRARTEDVHRLHLRLHRVPVVEYAVGGEQVGSGDLAQAIEDLNKILLIDGRHATLN